MKKHLWAICFTIVLIAFTTYAALDTFVISTVYDKNAVEMNTAMFGELASPSGGESGGAAAQIPAEAYSDESSYADENVSITLTESVAFQ